MEKVRELVSSPSKTTTGMYSRARALRASDKKGLLARGKELEEPLEDEEETSKVVRGMGLVFFEALARLRTLDQTPVSHAHEKTDRKNGLLGGGGGEGRNEKQRQP